MPTFMNDDPEELKNLATQSQLSSTEPQKHLQESLTAKTATVTDSTHVEGVLNAHGASLNEQPSLDNPCEEHHEFTDLNGSVNIKTDTIASSSGGHNMNNEGHAIEMDIGESGVPSNKMLPSNNTTDASSHAESPMLLDITNLSDPSSDVLTDSHAHAHAQAQAQAQAQARGDTTQPSLESQPQPHIANDAVVNATNDAIAAVTASFIDEIHVVGSQTSSNSLGLPDLASLKQSIENSSSIAKEANKQNAAPMSVPTPVASIDVASTPDPMASTVSSMNATTHADLLASNTAPVISQTEMKAPDASNVMLQGVHVANITSAVIPQPQTFLTSPMANAGETLTPTTLAQSKTCIPYQNMTSTAQPKYVDTRKVMKCPKCPSTFYSKGGYYRHVKKCGTPKGK